MMGGFLTRLSSDQPFDKCRQGLKKLTRNGVAKGQHLSI